MKLLIILLFCTTAFSQQSWKVPIERHNQTYTITFSIISEPWIDIKVKHVYAIIDTAIKDKKYYRVIKNPKDFYIDQSKYMFQRWVIEGNTVYW